MQRREQEFDFRDESPEIPARHRKGVKRNDFWVFGCIAAVGGFFLVACAASVALYIWLAPAVRMAGIDQPLPVVEADLAGLLEAWEKNPIATRDKYAGKAVRVSGHLSEVSINVHHQTYIHVATKTKAGWGDRRLMIYVREEDLLRQVGKSNKEDRITVDVVFSQGTDQSPKSHLQAVWAGK